MCSVCGWSSFGRLVICGLRVCVYAIVVGFDLEREREREREGNWLWVNLVVYAICGEVSVCCDGK